MQDSNSKNVPCVTTVVVPSETQAAAEINNKKKIVQQGEICGKPRFLINSDAVINFNSGFDKKLLCDGITFTAGQACAYSCTFCYVADVLKSNSLLRQLRQDRGLNWEGMAVEITNAAAKVRAQLLDRKGKPKFNDPNDTRVIYGSPLVDIAATMEQARVTIAICNAILELTHWQIRLLSKSPFLSYVAKQIPAKYKNRVIYGLSTGTVDSKLAAAFEKGTGLVSKRLETLRWLQDNGYRTYGMVCPILPQSDYVVFAETVVAAIDITKCEHIWAEPINVRGASLIATAQALREAGYNPQAELLEHVSNDKAAWEQYARDTYTALAAVVPHNKLRFLQYVQGGNKAWWQERKDQGVVMLEHAKRKKKAKVKTAKTATGEVANG